jgi:hypothetical protein
MEDKKVPGEAAGLLIADADAFLRSSLWRPGQFANLSVLPKRVHLPKGRRKVKIEDLRCHCAPMLLPSVCSSKMALASFASDAEWDRP